MKIVTAVLGAAVVFLWIRTSDLQDEVRLATSLADDAEAEVSRLKSRVDDLEDQVADLENRR